MILIMYVQLQLVLLRNSDKAKETVSQLLVSRIDLPNWHVKTVERILQSKVGVYFIQFLQQQFFTVTPRISNNNKLDALIKKKNTFFQDMY
jgi:hypothetical protein